MKNENRGLFDVFGETFSRTVKEITEKGGSFYEEQKLRSRITTEDRQIEKLKTNIGNLIYARFSEGENVDESVLELCEQIRGHEESIHALRKEIVTRKGLRFCPNCKKEVDSAALFCPNCGAQMPLPEPIEDKSEPLMSDQEKEAADGIFAEAGPETEKDDRFENKTRISLSKGGEEDPFKGDGEA